MINKETVLVKIYELRDPRDLQCSPKYVGITSKNLEARLKEHIIDSKRGKTYKRNWINSLIEDNIIPTIHFIEEIRGIQEAFEIEKYWIKEFTDQGYKLTNSTKGGEGYNGGVISDELKKHLSEVNTGENHPQYNHYLDREYIVTCYMLGEAAPLISRKLGISIGCVYDTLRSYNIDTSKTSKDYSTKFLQYSLKGDFIKIFGTALDVKRELNLIGVNKSRLLKHACGGYMWKEYIDDNYPLKIPTYTRYYGNKFMKKLVEKY